MEYTDPRDAADAVKGSDGRYLLNNKIRVEISIRKDGGRNIDRRDDREEYRDDRRYDDRRDNYRDTREPYRDPRDTYRDSRDTYRDDRRDDRRDAFPRDNFREERRGPKANPKRTDFRVKYFDLNRSTKWQHIKDHLRELQCIPVYCDTFGDGTASADFNNESDANYVVEKMDGITFDGVVIHAKRDYDHVENGNNGVREEAPQEVVRGRSRSRDVRFRDGTVESSDRHQSDSCLLNFFVILCDNFAISKLFSSSCSSGSPVVNLFTLLFTIGVILIARYLTSANHSLIVCLLRGHRCQVQ